MYKLTIETPYNTIYLLVDDENSEEIEEILSQPWVKSVKKEQSVINDGRNEGFKRLVRRKREV